MTRLLQILFLFIGVCVLQSNAKPQSKSSPEEEARRIVIAGNYARPNLFDDLRGTRRKSNISGLSTMTSPKVKWSNGILFYEFNSNFTFPQEEKDRIVNAMGVISSVSCIVFKERVDEPNYVSITGVPEKESGCWADAGMVGGKQLMNLPADCSKFQEVVIHETMHALGFHHEQTRFDRDIFVLVQWDSLPKDKYGNYNKLPRTVAFPPYDYDFYTFMHYTMEGYDPGTIGMILTKEYEGKVRNEEVGGSKNLTQTDIYRLRSAYRCNNVNNHLEERPEPPVPVTTGAPVDPDTTAAP